MNISASFGRFAALAASAATISLSASQGTVVGWMKPSDEWQDQVYLVDDAGKNRLQLRVFSARAEANIQLANGKSASLWRCGSGFAQMKDQWLHVAFVWKDDGSARLYVNGKPYDPTTLYGDRRDSIVGEQLGGATKFRSLPATARDFRREARAWSAKEVLAEYFKACPVDLVMDDSFIAAGEEASATWILAPFGALTRPVIAEGWSAGPATVEIATRIQRVGAKGAVEPAVLAETPFVRHEITRAVEMKTAPRAWAPGLYRMAVTIRRVGEREGTVRSLFFRAIAPVRLDFANASDAPWRKTRTLFEKTYAAPSDVRWSSGDTRTATDRVGAYLEAGEDVGNRFADILSMDASSIGRPCLLEIEWPDDKPRQMGLYMYEITPASCRDHLQGGLVTGDEIPNTLKRQVRRYLYVPTGTNALFEARTFVRGRPAAVAKITLSQLAEPLPVLKIRRPACGKGRSFGHCDEDQTFDNNIGSAIMGAPVEETLRNLVSYFGYTGQNAFSYSVIRYGADYGAIDGSVKLPSNWPREQGAWKGVIRTLKANGIDFLAQSTMGNIPAFSNHDCLDDTLEEKGLILRNPDGSLVKGLAKGHCRPDITRPETHQMIADAVTPTLAYALRNGAESASLEVKGDIFSNWTFPSASLGPADEPGRTAVTTAAFKKTLDAIKAAAPGGKIRVIADPTDEKKATLGIDVDKIAALGGFEFATMRGNTDYYFARFNGQTRGATEGLDRLYDPAAPQLKKLAAMSEGGSLPLAMVYPQYFETFVKPLGDDKRFQNYFQNADIKPHGRWYLKEPAYCLAKADALRFVIGAQPLGSLGNEDETREFCRAYCALPAKPFKTVAGVDDPVVARWFDAPEGTYLYVVNYCHVPVEAKLNTMASAEDLSTGETVALAALALRPFELRSFLVPSAAGLAAKNLVLSLGAYDRTAFDARRAELAPIIAKLRTGGIDCADAEAMLARAERALAEGRLAAAHWGFFHRSVQAAVEAFAQYDELVAENAMHEAGRWAVNGGCNYFSRIGNRLFSPDRKWDGKTYGYYGEGARTVAREKEFCDPASPELELFTTERFHISGYKFRLPKGRYHVKIHAKWAYPHSFREAGRQTATYSLNGRMLADVDWYADSHGDIKKPFVLEGDVENEDVLDIAIASVKCPDACIVNGIEITKLETVPFEISGSGVTVRFDGANGAIESVKGTDGIERVRPAPELFMLSLLDAKGDETILKSTDFAFAREGNVFVYRRDGGMTVRMTFAAENGALKAKVAVDGCPKGLRLNWVDGPRVDVPESSLLYWPIYDGCEVSDFTIYEQGDSWLVDRPLGFPQRCKTDPPLYPGNATMQFLASYAKGKGLYFAAHDATHCQKSVRWSRVRPGTVRLSLQTFCGDGRRDGGWESAFDYVIRPYDGGWMKACSFYRDFVKSLPGLALPAKRPEWLEKSPVVVCYPVRGTGVDNQPLDMGPNCYYPYVNALPEIERYQRYFGTGILALLMHWEGTAPWAPPYVWPPYGGVEKLAEFRDALHAKGNYLGLYCSGTAWTQVSMIIPTYSRTMEYTNERLDRFMMRGPKGEIDAQVCNHPRAQRIGYDMCLTEQWSRETVLREIRAMGDFGVDYCQFFDQNLGGGPHLCWSDGHHHPSVPGAWMTKAMRTLQDEAVKSGMVIGCEGGAAHPFVENLFFNDGRAFFPVRYGRPVPGLSFVFHEWTSNFSGNGCGQKKSTAFRLAYCFHNGDFLTLVLAEPGHLSPAWGTWWTAHMDDAEQSLVLKLAKEFNDFRRRYPQFLFRGRMIEPFVEVGAPEVDVDLSTGAKPRLFRYPAALSSFWQAADGTRLGLVTNYQPVPLEITLARPGGSPERRTLAPHETIELR